MNSAINKPNRRQNPPYFIGSKSFNRHSLPVPQPDGNLGLIQVIRPVIFNAELLFGISHIICLQQLMIISILVIIISRITGVCSDTRGGIIIAVTVVTSVS